MRIYYESKDTYCLTPCPHGIINGYTGKIRYVGSVSCSYCWHFIRRSLKKKWVDCNYKEKK